MDRTQATIMCGDAIRLQEMNLSSLIGEDATGLNGKDSITEIAKYMESLTGHEKCKTFVESILGMDVLKIVESIITMMAEGNHFNFSLYLLLRCLKVCASTVHLFDYASVFTSNAKVVFLFSLFISIYATRSESNDKTTFTEYISIFKELNCAGSYTILNLLHKNVCADVLSSVKDSANTIKRIRTTGKERLLTHSLMYVLITNFKILDSFRCRNIQPFDTTTTNGAPEYIQENFILSYGLESLLEIDTRYYLIESYKNLVNTVDINNGLTSDGDIDRVHQVPIIIGLLATSIVPYAIDLTSKGMDFGVNNNELKDVKSVHINGMKSIPASYKKYTKEKYVYERKKTHENEDSLIVTNDKKPEDIKSVITTDEKRMEKIFDNGIIKLLLAKKK